MTGNISRYLLWAFLIIAVITIAGTLVYSFNNGQIALPGNADFSTASPENPNLSENEVISHIKRVLALPPYERTGVSDFTCTYMGDGKWSGTFKSQNTAYPWNFYETTKIVEIQGLQKTLDSVPDLNMEEILDIFESVPNISD